MRADLLEALEEIKKGIETRFGAFEDFNVAAIKKIIFVALATRMPRHQAAKVTGCSLRTIFNHTKAITEYRPAERQRPITRPNPHKRKPYVPDPLFTYDQLDKLRSVTDFRNFIAKQSKYFNPAKRDLLLERLREVLGFEQDLFSRRALVEMIDDLEEIA